MAESIHLALHNAKRKNKSNHLLLRNFFVLDQTIDIHACHKSLFFMFVIEGSGSFEIDGKIYPAAVNNVIAANCAGRMSRLRSNGRWYVLSLVYAPECENTFRSLGLLEDPPVWQPLHASRIREQIRIMAKVAKTINTDDIADQMDLLALALLLDCRERSALRQSEHQQQLLLRIIDYVNSRYNEKLFINDLAKSFGVSRTHFFRLWKQITTLPPHSYINHLRIKHACDMINNSQMNLNQIADAVGFDDPHLFSCRFKKIIGISPREYRKSVIN